MVVIFALKSLNPRKFSRGNCLCTFFLGRKLTEISMVFPAPIGARDNSCRALSLAVTKSSVTTFALGLEENFKDTFVSEFHKGVGCSYCFAFWNVFSCLGFVFMINYWMVVLFRVAGVNMRQWGGVGNDPVVNNGQPSSCGNGGGPRNFEPRHCTKSRFWMQRRIAIDSSHFTKFSRLTTRWFSFWSCECISSLIFCKICKCLRNINKIY